MKKNRYTFERSNGHLLINYGIIRAAMNSNACVDALRWAMAGKQSPMGITGWWWTLKECLEYNRSYLLWLIERVTDLPDVYVEEIYMLTGHAIIRIAGNRRIVFSIHGRHVSPNGNVVYWKAGHERSVKDLKWRPAKKRVKA
jgi:hypothetical protein